MKLSEDFVQKMAEQFSTILGVGYSASVPGTIGSLFGILIYMFLKDTPLLVYGFVVFFMFVLGVVAGDIVEGVYGIKDPAFVIVDETVGMLIAMMGVPYSFMAIFVGFILFRIMDISKIPPLNVFEKFGGGFGIMMDDAVGGLIVNLILQVFFR